MEYSEIKRIAEVKKIEIQDIARELDMTPNGFRASIKKETIPLRKLKMLCETLRINPICFFDRVNSTYINVGGHMQNGNNNKLTIDSKDREIELLKQQIEDKNEIINLLRARK